MNRLAAVLALAVALPAAAQEKKPEEIVLDHDFTWSVVEYAHIPEAGTREVSLSESMLVVTPSREGVAGRLGGRCLSLTDADTADMSYRMVGHCVLRDAEGDAIFERIEESAGPGGNPGAGRGFVSGGTGKFAGISGEYAYTTDYVAGMKERSYQGVGRKTGTLTRTAP
jgi:hypothetical protein